MKLILFILFFSSQGFCQNQTQLDKKLESILKKELSAGTILLKKTKSSRNYLRVYNSRVEILKLQVKKLRKLKFIARDKKRIQDYEKGINKFYFGTKQLGNTIISKYKNFKDRGTFHLIHGLLIFEFESNSKEIESNLLKASSLLKDEVLKLQAYGKLGDYYFNTKAFPRAIVAYNKALEIKAKSRWSDKFNYNLGLSHFKLDRFKSAINGMASIINDSKDPKQQSFYYAQALQRIPEFYVFAGAPTKGFQFLEDRNVETQKLVDYSRYVYKKGFFKKYEKLTYLIRSKIKARKELLEFEIDTYQFLANSDYYKSFRVVANIRSSIMKKAETKKLDSRQSEKFAQANISLITKALEQINRKDFNYKDQYWEILVNDTLSLLKSMVIIDPSKKSYYELRYSQILLKSGRSKEALEGFISTYEGINKDSKESSESLESIVTLLNDESKDVQRKNKEYFSEYLAKGKTPLVRKFCYLKLYDFAVEDKKLAEAFLVSKKIQTEFNDSSSTIPMLTKVSSLASSMGNLNLIRDIRKFSNQFPALRTSKSLNVVTSAGYQNLVLTKINGMIADQKTPKREVIKKLQTIFYSKAIDRENRLISGFNALVLLKQQKDKKEFNDFFRTFVQTQSGLEVREYGPRLNTMIDEFTELQLLEKFTLRTLNLEKQCKTKVSTSYKSSFLRSFEESLALEKENDFGGFFKLCSKSRDFLEYSSALLYEYSDSSDEKDVTRKVSFIDRYWGRKSQIKYRIIADYIIANFNSLDGIGDDSFKSFLSKLKAFNRSLSDAYLSRLIASFEKVFSIKLKTFKSDFSTSLEYNLTITAQVLASVSEFSLIYLNDFQGVFQRSVLEKIFYFATSEFKNLGKQEQEILKETMIPFYEKYKELNLQVSSELKFLSLYRVRRYLYRPGQFYSFDVEAI